MSTTISGTTGVDRFGDSTISGHVVQIGSYLTGTMQTGTATIPADDTIPQITEGAQIMSMVFTPKRIGSILRIDVVAHIMSNSSGIQCLALFNGNTDAIACALLGSGVDEKNVPITAYMTTTSLNPITFSVRTGGNGGAYTFNGSSGAGLFGGTIKSSINVMEIAQ